MSAVKQIYISFNDGFLTNTELAHITTQPSVTFGSKPQLEINLVLPNSDGGSIGANLSGADSWEFGIDDNFLLSSDPFVRTHNENIDSTLAADGKIIVDADCTSEAFRNKIDGKQAMQAYAELKGLDATSGVIYDYIFRIQALGTLFN